MKKTTLITILTASILVVLAGASVGLVYAFSPSSDSEITVVNVTTQSDDDTVTLVINCEENEGTEPGNKQGSGNQFRRNLAYMHKIQFRNSTTDEVLYQEQFQNQWRHRVQACNTFTYQFQVEGLEQGQMLQLRITYNNGKVFMYNFEVNN
ncbi:MAG: hypothetical protein HZR80_09815 [Candidatus Heimdallarchaeota archaeon]